MQSKDSANFLIDIMNHGNNGQVTTSNFTSNYIINLLQVTIKFYNLI
jgi:hypothetical protein